MADELASNALAGIGTSFSRWSSGSSSWQLIAEITEIGGPNKAKEMIEVTHLKSPDKYKEFVGGLKEAGTCSLSMNFTKETYDIMDADFESDVKQNYQIVIPDATLTTIEFEGNVSELGLSIPVGDKISSDVTIQISGKPVVSEGSSGA